MARRQPQRRTPLGSGRQADNVVRGTGKGTNENLRNIGVTGNIPFQRGQRSPRGRAPQNPHDPTSKDPFMRAGMSMGSNDTDIFSRAGISMNRKRRK